MSNATDDDALGRASTSDAEEVEALQSMADALNSEIERLDSQNAESDTESVRSSASEKAEIRALESMVEALKSEIVYLVRLAAESDKDTEMRSEALSLKLQALQSEVEVLESEIEALKEASATSAPIPTSYRTEEHSFLPTSAPSPAQIPNPTSKPPTSSQITALENVLSIPTAGPAIAGFTSDSNGCKDMPLSIGCQAETMNGTVMECDQLQFVTIRDDSLRIKWTYHLTNNCPHPRMLARQHLTSCSVCMPSGLDCTKATQVFFPRSTAERYFTLQPYERAEETEEVIVLLNSQTRCMFSRKVGVMVLGSGAGSFTIDLKYAWVSPTDESQTESSEPSEAEGGGQNTDEITNKVVKTDEVGSSTASPVPSNPPMASPPDDCECIQCYIGTDSPSASPSTSLQPTGKGKGKKLSFGKRKSKGKGASCAELDASCDHQELCRDYCFEAPSAAPSVSSEPSASMFPSTSPSMSSEPSGKGGKGVGKGGKGKGGIGKVRCVSIICSRQRYAVFLLT